MRVYLTAARLSFRRYITYRSASFAGAITNTARIVVNLGPTSDTSANNNAGPVPVTVVAASSDIAVAKTGNPASGVAPGTVRLSVGLEDVDDLVWDLERGLHAARGSAVVA